MIRPTGQIHLATGLHSEEGASHVYHFPRKEEGEPGEAEEGYGACTEDVVVGGGVGVFAACSKIASAEGERDKAGCGEAGLK